MLPDVKGILMRDIANLNLKIYQKLNNIIMKSGKFSIWNEFYEFIIMCYELPFEERVCISSLFLYLKDNNVIERNELILMYAHGMYLLAKYNKLPIYGDGFNA